jgi:hypothetical protein
LVKVEISVQKHAEIFRVNIITEHKMIRKF